MTAIGVVPPALALLLVACEPTLTVGSSACTPPIRAGEDGFVPGAASDDPVKTPWATDFETGFCDYAFDRGFCYADPNASFEIVEGPAHSGRNAAAFTIFPDDPASRQARCVREGLLPDGATYGAWFYLPTEPTMIDNWNLIHLQGAETGSEVHHGLWDVSVRHGADDVLHLYLRDFLGTLGTMPEAAPEVPVGQWFHIELTVQRAADDTGSVALRQDGEEVLAFDSIITDDSEWGQFYVGNLAGALTPPDSTVYVDDITIVATP